MKKFSLQAERHSQPGGPPRTSRPRTEVFEQNDTATGLVHHVPHHLFTCIFFYFLIDYKHKHTATGLGCHVPHALYVWNFFYFLDYKHKRRPRAGVKHQAAEARATVIFFIDSPENPIYKKKMKGKNETKKTNQKSK